MVILMLLLLSADFFSKQIFSKNSFRNTIKVKQFISRSGPTFCQACSGSSLQRFSTDDTSMQRVKRYNGEFVH